MTSFQDKVDELQKEVDKLDKKLGFSGQYGKYIFFGGIASPFVISFLLYATNFKFVRDENNNPNRKKIIKYTIMLTIVEYICLYFFYQKYKD
jgi:hypothetical protein